MVWVSAAATRSVRPRIEWSIVELVGLFGDDNNLTRNEHKVYFDSYWSS